MRGGEMLDADGRVVMPGLVECHTHLAWAGDRADEFQLRVAGATYQQVQEAGGGIASTVHATRNASDEVLRALARKRLDRFLRYGVTTVEAKSGYGLSLEQELRHARGLPRRLRTLHPVDVVPTLLGRPRGPDRVSRTAPTTTSKLIVKKMIPAGGQAEAGPLLRRLLRAGRLHVGAVPAGARGGPGERPAAEASRRPAQLHGRHRDGGRAGSRVGGPPGPCERRAASPR